MASQNCTTYKTKITEEVELLNYLKLFNVIWLTGGLASEMEEDMIAYRKVTDKFQDGIHFEESEMWLVGNGSLWPYAMRVEFAVWQRGYNYNALLNFWKKLLL